MPWKWWETQVYKLPKDDHVAPHVAAHAGMLFRESIGRAEGSGGVTPLRHDGIVDVHGKAEV